MLPACRVWSPCVRRIGLSRYRQGEKVLMAKSPRPRPISNIANTMKRVSKARFVFEGADSLGADLGGVGLRDKAIER